MIVNLKYRETTGILLKVIASSFLFFYAAAGAYSETLHLQQKMDEINLENYSCFYQDKSGLMTINDVSSMDKSMFSTRAHAKNQFGYSRSAIWLRIDVINDYDKPLNWLIESEYPLLDYISVYSPDGRSYKSLDAGDMLPFSKMPRGFHHFTAELSAPPGNSTYYVRIQSDGSVNVSLRAWDFNSFILHFIYSNGFQWIFYGIMLALCIYNMIIFLAALDRIYLYLSGFIFSIMLFDFIHNGMARKFLWPENTWWANHCHPFIMFISLMMLLKFTQHFMNTRATQPLAHKILIGFIYYSVSAAAISLIIPYNAATILSGLTCILIFFLLLIMVVFPKLKENRKIALYYSFSCLFFFLGVFLVVLRSFGIIDDSFIVSNGYQIGIASGNILLSIGLADKLNRLQKDNRNALTSLKESEERYRLFFERAHDAIVFAIDNIPVYANKNMIRITGYTDEEFYSKSIEDFFIVENPDEVNVWKTIADLNAGIINNSQFEAVLINNTGEKIDVIMSLSSLTTGSGIGIFIIITDITSIKHSSKIIQEQYNGIQSQVNTLETLNRELIEAQTIIVNANIEIEKEKEYLSATLSSIGDGVISYDTEGKIFLMNRIAEDLTGVNSSDAIGKNVRDVLRLSNDVNGDQLFNTIGMAMEKYNFNDIGVPFRLNSRTGDDRVVELNSSVIKLDNKPIGIVLAFRDITLKTKIDTEIIKMSKLETIGILAGGIAHDFNNLLTGISGNISIAKSMTADDHSLSEIISDIEKAVRRSSALTKQLLTFARGGDPLKAPTSLKEIIHECAKFIVKDPSYKCIIEIDEDIHDVLVDSNQISQAFNNLLINALQAMPEGGEVLITASNLREIPTDLPLLQGEYVDIRISDTGCGIPKESLNKIFDPFFTTKNSGTGLGLTSTYSIIKKHLGVINVYSEIDRGTTFEIYLKAADEPAVSVQPSSRTIISTCGGSILIMDDEEYILEVFSKMLRYHGYDVCCVKNGEEAIKVFREHHESGRPFDYVILDLTVYGGMGGKEAITLLKKIDPAIKAIVSSGYSENPVMANYRDYGFSGVLTKPYSIDDILKVLS